MGRKAPGNAQSPAAYASRLTKSTKTLASSATTAGAQSRSAKLAFFENQIRPLLSKHCFECHNDTKQEGGLRLDFRQAMRTGGESGPTLTDVHGNVVKEILA